MLVDFTFLFVVSVSTHFSFNHPSTSSTWGAQSQSTGHLDVFSLLYSGRAPHWAWSHLSPLVYRKIGNTDNHLESPQVCTCLILKVFVFLTLYIFSSAEFGPNISWYFSQYLWIHDRYTVLIFSLKNSHKRLPHITNHTWRISHVNEK